jgi:hypothetical protein
MVTATIVSSAAGCILTEPLNGLTGGGGAGGDDAMSDVATDTTAQEGGGSGDGPSATDAPPDVADGGTKLDASDGGPASDVVQPDVVTPTGECADAGALLCEDFENGLNAAKWSTTNQLATAVVDGTQHHRGASALHLNAPALTTDGSAVNVAANIRHTEAMLPSTVFVRAFVMFSAAQPQSVEQFFLAQQSASPYYGLQLELDQGTGDYAMTDWSVTPNFYQVSTVGAAAASWTCVEWELDPPASGSTMTNSDLWVNDAEVPSLHITNTPMTDLEVLGFGIGFYQVTSLPAYDLWIDDIYVDTSRVGCTK